MFKYIILCTYFFLQKSKIWPHLDRKVNVCVCERLNTRGVVMCIHSLPCFSENIHAQEQSEDSKKEVNTARRKSSYERVCVCGSGKSTRGPVADLTGMTPKRNAFSMTTKSFGRIFIKELGQHSFLKPPQ